MRATSLAALLLAAFPACAEEAPPYVPVPIPDDTDKRGGRPASQWEDGAWQQKRFYDLHAAEPPAPPLIDHPCAHFEGPDADLIEIKLVSDASPEPVGLMIPHAYAYGMRQDAYRYIELDGSARLRFWVHDLAPFEDFRRRHSMSKVVEDDIGMLINPGGSASVERRLRIALAPSIIDADAMELSPDNPQFVPDADLGLLRIVEVGETRLRRPEVRVWARLDEANGAADFIYCGKATGNHRCTHYMSAGEININMSYDAAFLDEWQRIRQGMETFFGCSLAAYEETIKGEEYRVDEQ